MTDPLASVTIAGHDAWALADLGLAFSATEEVTPALVGAQISTEGDELVTLATDRYKVGRHRAPVMRPADATSARERFAGGDGSDAPEIPPGVLLPRDALLWIRANARGPRTHGERVVTIEVLREEEPPAKHRGRPVTRNANAHSYAIRVLVQYNAPKTRRAFTWEGVTEYAVLPPVGRLIDDARTAEPAVLDGDVWEPRSIAAVVRVSGGVPIIMRATKPHEGRESGTVYFASRATNASERVVVDGVFQANRRFR